MLYVLSLSPRLSIHPPPHPHPTHPSIPSFLLLLTIKCATTRIQALCKNISIIIFTLFWLKIKKAKYLTMQWFNIKPIKSLTQNWWCWPYLYSVVLISTKTCALLHAPKLPPATVSRALNKPLVKYWNHFIAYLPHIDCEILESLLKSLKWIRTLKNQHLLSLSNFFILGNHA